MGERTPKEIADGIVEKHVRRGEVGLTLAIEDAIRAALAVPKGYVRVVQIVGPYAVGRFERERGELLKPGQQLAIIEAAAARAAGEKP